MRSLACRLPALAVLLAILVCGKARAESPSPEELARRHHERATAFYNLGQFEDAIAEYRKGYEQQADPVFLLNIGEAYRQLGAHEKALFFYRRYLFAVPEAPNRAAIDERIAALEQLVAAEQRARSPAPAEPLSTIPSSRGQPWTSSPGVLEAESPVPRPSPPIYHRWWFWAGIGGIVVSGIAVGLLVSASKGSSAPPTDLGTMRFF